MGKAAFERILVFSMQNQELEETVAYLTKNLEPIVKSSETTLICFPREKETDLGSLLERAVRNCGGLPVFWEKDLRWKELLQIAFRSKASTIIATPLILLGLTKIARYGKIPLHLYNAALAGYPCLDWIMDGIAKNLDCKLWGIFDPGVPSVVAGMSCKCGRGIHLRDDKYAVDIIGDDGEPLPAGEEGMVLLYPRNDKNAGIITQIRARLMQGICPCGNPSPKLIDVDAILFRNSAIMQAAGEILSWSSVLDCAFKRTPSGLELDVVCFQGEKLPAFPDCAKLVVRPWNPEKDCPIGPGACWGNV